MIKDAARDRSIQLLGADLNILDMAGRRGNRTAVLSALNLIEPGLLGTSVGWAVKFLQKCAKQAFLLYTTESANFLVDFGHRSGHISGEPNRDFQLDMFLLFLTDQGSPRIVRY